MSERDDLKRYIDAVKGRPLSWGLAIEIKCVLGSRYDGGDKLSAADRTRLQLVINVMLARGVEPAKSLLTVYQRRALRAQKRRRA